jgi:type VI secretion system VasD/TssJ family lipoprotein
MRSRNRNRDRGLIWPILALAVFTLACGAPAAPQMPQQPETPEQPEVPEIDGLTTTPGGGSRAGAKCPHFPLSVYLNGHAVMNRNKAGQPQPAEVKAYLLRGRQTFSELDFDTLRREGDKALGDDLVSALSFVVFPGKFKIKPIKAPAGTAFVALVGLFRNPDGQRWKLVFDVRNLSGRCKKGQLHTPLKANLYQNTLRLDRQMPADQE